MLSLEPMSINVEVEKNNNENATSLIRRFTKKVQEGGFLNKVRSLRYSARKESPYVRKKKTLKVLRRREDTAKQIKLGKMVERRRR
jgi:hypothetical protein